MSFYPEPDSHVRDKVKVVLDFSKYATRKALEHATGVDTSKLAAKSDFITLKAEVNKLDINESIKFLTGLNNFKTNVDKLNIGNLTVPKDLKKLNDVQDKEVAINTVYNTLNKQVNNLKKKNSDVSVLV